jgi:hypothetical protein
MEVAHVDKGTEQYHQDLNSILKDRDVKWYKGHYLRLNLILVRLWFPLETTSR